MKIEDRIDEYILKNKETRLSLDFYELDEGRKTELLKKVSMMGFKGIIWLLENSFDLIAKEVSDELERSASETSLMKIDKIKNKTRKLKELQKKAEQYKESYVRVVFKIESLIDKEDEPDKEEEEDF